MLNIKAITTYDLNLLLKKKFGKRLKTDSLKTLNGDIIGTLDSKAITISFVNNEYLNVYTTNNDVIDELISFLRKTVDGIKPICSYEMVSKGKNIFVIEWDFKNPEERIKEIVNGYAYSDKIKVSNIKLYNSKKITEYLDENKIYGLYPGSLQDIEKINTMNEIELYFAIYKLSWKIWESSRNNDSDLEEDKYALEYLIYQTTRFGVELNEPCENKHILKTASYNAWYNFYSSYLKKFLNKEQWECFIAARDNNEKIIDNQLGKSIIKEKLKVLKK